MANYLEMNREELTAEKAKLNEQYKKFLAMNLKLNMARGKPGPHQMDLAMGLLQMNDYTTDAGTDARNYGDLEGLHEARVLFADVFGVKPEEVFVGGNSSLQLMYNLINIGYVFGFPESPCPWSQVEKRKFLCPVPGYDRHFAITEEYGFELISVPMTPNGPDMDIVEKLVAEDDTIKGIWCVPQYSNPDGYTYSDETIDRMAKMKTAAEDASKTVAAPYNAALSAGSNQGPTNQALIDAVTQRVADYRKANGLASATPVPVDAVTASASGLDPHISVANAQAQAPRVATARGVSLDQVQRLLNEHTEGRVLGLLGEPRVNVLRLNLALNAASAQAPQAQAATK